MDCKLVLAIAAKVNTAALVRDALRYDFMRGMTPRDLHRLVTDFSSEYLDAEIDKLIAEKSYDKAEKG